MTDVFEHTPQVWNAAQLRDALKYLPDDAPIHIGVAGDPGDFDGYRNFVLVDAHQVQNGGRPPPQRRNEPRRWKH
ncbi:DUF6225 family protein [Streptomyces sp. NBC_01363]|uniref:DUF6225 family protein n=1 Tax=Streptomyces sp. NBC_01363 TaxID=2903840 RepID=UPI0022514FD9|nr:DUF6225 family protein [Streptomyces sp. NBC_01363]MCX4732733.1 DUF6225 family protein [Streptomyces sp. NBC_01363]